MKGGHFFYQPSDRPPILSFISPLADSENSVTAPLTTTELGDVAVSSSTFPRGSFSYRPLLQVLLLSCSLTPNPLPTFAALLNSSGNWLLGAAWKLASQEMKALCEKTRQLTAAPEPDFVPQRTVTVADALLLEWAAPSTGLALRVLQQCIAGASGLDVDSGRVRNRIAKVKIGLKKVANKGETACSRESVALRLASPFFLASGTSYLPILTVAQQAKANAARAKAEATRPGEDLFSCPPQTGGDLD